MIEDQKEMNELTVKLLQFLEDFPGIEEIGEHIIAPPLAFAAMAIKIALECGELEPFVQWIGGYAEARTAAIMAAAQNQTIAGQAH